MDEARAEFLADAIFAAATGGGYAEDMGAAGLTDGPLERGEVLSRVEQVNSSIDLLTPYVQAAG